MGLTNDLKLEIQPLFSFGFWRT